VLLRWRVRSLSHSARLCMAQSLSVSIIRSPDYMRFQEANLYLYALPAAEMIERMKLAAPRGFKISSNVLSLAGLRCGHYGYKPVMRKIVENTIRWLRGRLKIFRISIRCVIVHSPIFMMRISYMAVSSHQSSTQCLRRSVMIELQHGRRAISIKPPKLPSEHASTL